MSDYLLKIRSTADLAGLQSAQRGVAALGSKISSSFSGLSGLSGLLTGGILTAWGKQLLTEADHLQDLSDQAKTSAEDLQRLAAATKTGGVEIDALSQSLGKLALFQAKLAAGDKDATTLATSLGLDARAAATATRIDLFHQLADAFQGLPNPASQARAAVAIFGDQGQRLIPILEQGREAIKGMGDAASVMSNKTVAELAKVNAEMEKAVTLAKNFGSGLIASAASGAAGLGVLIGTLAERNRIDEEYQERVKAINAAEDRSSNTGVARAYAVKQARKKAIEEEGPFSVVLGTGKAKRDKAGEDAGRAFDQEIANADTARRQALLADAKAARDRQLAALASAATDNFANPLGIEPPKPPKPPAPAGDTTTPSDSPRPSPFDNPPSPETLKDRITSIGGIIGSNTNAISYLSRTATATERSAIAIEKVASQLGTGRPATSVFSS